MERKFSILKNENGSALLISLLILGLLTLLGIFATNTTNIEMQIAGNDKLHKLSFYAAEAARGCVAGGTGLYGPDNITPLSPHYFPNNAGPYIQITSEPYIQITSEPSVPYPLSSVQSFTGSVEYKNFSEPPRGSGYEVGKFKAHRYEMTCNGYGPSHAESRIAAGFYRIGF